MVTLGIAVLDAFSPHFNPIVLYIGAFFVDGILAENGFYSRKEK